MASVSIEVYGYRVDLADSRKNRLTPLSPFSFSSAGTGEGGRKQRETKGGGGGW